MQITTMGLVLRATKTGESDRVLSILTPSLGVVSAIAKGSLRLKSKLLSATGLFCYAEFSLFEGKSMYGVDEASVKEVFFGLHEDVEAMAVGMYLAELVSTLTPTGQEAKLQLRLLLNSLYMLSEKKRSPRFVKAVFELRALSSAGYMPDLVTCADCEKYEGGSFYFDTQSACLFCGECASNRNLFCNLDAAALCGMRHIVFSADEKLFAFQLAGGSLLQLSHVAAQYTMHCIEKPLKSLSFLETVLT